MIYIYRYYMSLMSFSLRNYCTIRRTAPFVISAKPHFLDDLRRVAAHSWTPAECGSPTWPTF